MRGPATWAVGCFVVGAAVLLLAHPDLLRLAGALLMLAAVFLGVAAVANALLVDEEGDSRRSP